MPEADRHDTTARGQVLSLDAHLLAGCAAYHDACGEQARILAAPGVQDAAADRRLAELTDRIIAALDTISTLPARTPAGRRAKAALVAALLPQAAEEVQLTPDCTEIRLAVSLASDCLRDLR